jgi:hypothetical protein
MLPYILAAVGGYLIGDSLKGKADVGMMAKGGWIEKPMTGGRKKYVKESNEYKHEIFKKADGKYYVSTTILSSKSGVDEYSQTYESNISDDFNSLEEAKKYVANKYADGGMMAKGGSVEEYPELRKVANKIANDTAAKINKEVKDIKSEMPYKAQWVLEEVVRDLEDRI